MNLLLSTLGGLGIMAASLILGCLAALLLRAFGRGIHHPAWGLTLALLLIPLDAILPPGGAIGMTIAFVPIFAVLLWATGARSTSGRPESHRSRVA